MGPTRGGGAQDAISNVLALQQRHALCFRLNACFCEMQAQSRLTFRYLMLQAFGFIRQVLGRETGRIEHLEQAQSNAEGFSEQGRMWKRPERSR
jgi:hypothetical protein